MYTNAEHCSVASISSCSFGFSDDSLTVKFAPLFMACDRRDILRFVVFVFANLQLAVLHFGIGAYRIEISMGVH